jgi:lipid-A-disaccharide synthase
MEVQRNFKTQLRTARAIHRAHPETRFLVASYKESQRRIAEEMRRAYADVPMQMFVGKTPEIMELSKACVAVSGSVSLELLYRVKPTVIVYRTDKFLETFIRPLLKAKYITLVNLLADKMLFPEYCHDRCPAAEAAASVLQWLDSDTAFGNTCRELLALREKTAMPGACARAARRIVEVVEGKRARTRAA